MTAFIIIESILILAAIFFLIRSSYHLHQSERLLSHKGKQTFTQWILHKDSPRGTYFEGIKW